jgi:CPA1 family monovalent cation:H+ antiporter
MDHHILQQTLIVVFFLAAVAIVQEITKKIRFPFVVALLLLGFMTQGVAYLLNAKLVVALPPDLIFFVLLPLLLFGSALHIQFHQFKMQFKTISFLATFGLMVSLTITGFLMTYFLGLPPLIAFLFGAMISSTDPIAVLALFKTLGVPRRLALIVDGESMFNDATAVIAFRVVLSLLTGAYAFTAQTAVYTVTHFTYVFIGSMVIGIVIGFIGALILEKIQNDLFVETTITVVLALGTFAVVEHYLHLSGVIATVLAGIVIGNLGVTKISGGLLSFIEEFWDYLGTLCIAVVFFFAAATIKLSIFDDWLFEVLIVVAITLFARAVSVYVTVFLTNSLPFFRNEPNVSMSWQHILNWGGLRGVIPLVLVFSLEESFVYKEQLLLYTLGVLLFSLFVNGLTIEPLLNRLGLHLPKKEEEILAAETNVYEIGKVRQRLARLPDVTEEKEIVKSIQAKLAQLEEKNRKKLLKLATFEDLRNSLFIQALQMERGIARELFYKKIITENVYFDLTAQLDLQEDAIEHPDLVTNKNISKEGFVETGYSFRRQFINVRAHISSWPLVARVFNAHPKTMMIERYMMVKARLLGNESVREYLDRVVQVIDTKDGQAAVAVVRDRYARFYRANKTELKELTQQYPKAIEQHQEEVALAFISKTSSWLPKNSGVL